VIRAATRPVPSCGVLKRVSGRPRLTRACCRLTVAEIPIVETRMRIAAFRASRSGWR
jgi:hypothetical protein